MSREHPGPTPHLSPAHGYHAFQGPWATKKLYSQFQTQGAPAWPRAPNGQPTGCIWPFMPTALGDGKVAQFTTHSYPTIGFWVMIAMSVLSILAIFSKNKYLKENA